jgi:hypothetical protein
MYNIFFHIAGIAFIEIIFYFYYIGPIETNVFQDSVKRIISPLVDAENNLTPIVIESPYNTSQIIIIENNEENDITQMIKYKMDIANKERDQYNHELFIWAIKWWIALFIFCISLLILEERNTIKKYCKRERIEESISISDMDVEMIQRVSLQPTNDDNMNNNDNFFIDDDNPQPDKIQKNTGDNDSEFYVKLKQNILQYVIISVGITGFEYLFFHYVIMKYHVISSEELEYLLYKMTLPMVHKYIQLHDD